MVARTLDWVAAAEGGGLSRARVLWRHILPNTVTQAIVYSMSDIVIVILAVVTLGYLGLGIQPPAPDWGSMITDGQNFLQTDQWMAHHAGSGRRVHRNRPVAARRRTRGHTAAE